MSTTPDLPLLAGVVYTSEEVEAYSREAVRLAARASVPAGWQITVCKDFGNPITVIAPNGYAAVVTSYDRNPSNVLYMLAETLLASSPSTPPDEATSRDAEDAARYRALRVPRDLGWPLAVSRVTPTNKPLELVGAKLDAAVDAARTQGDAA